MNIKKMSNSRKNKNTLTFDMNKSKDQLRKEITQSLTPEQRLQKLSSLINFTKKFSKNYSKAFQERLKKGNYFILK